MHANRKSTAPEMPGFWECIVFFIPAKVFGVRVSGRACQAMTTSSADVAHRILQRRSIENSNTQATLRPRNDGWINDRMAGWTGGWTNGLLDVCTEDGWMDKRIEK